MRRRDSSGNAGAEGDRGGIQWHVRPATLDDLDTVVHGNAAMARETENLELDAETLRAGVRAVLEERVAGRYYVLEESGTAGGTVVAQLLVTQEWSDWRNRAVWWIASVYVPPERRREGLFAVLYRAVVELARSEGAGGVRLYVDRTNGAAMRVYEALGMNGEHYTMYEAMFDDA